MSRARGTHTYSTAAEFMPRRAQLCISSIIPYCAVLCSRVPCALFTVHTLTRTVQQQQERRRRVHFEEQRGALERVHEHELELELECSEEQVQVTPSRERVGPEQ